MQQTDNSTCHKECQQLSMAQRGISTYLFLPITNFKVIMFTPKCLP